MEISHLFEKVKEYGGMTILTTNLRANLDESFARLNQFQLESPFPDKENRQRQWQDIFTEARGQACIRVIK